MDTSNEATRKVPAMTATPAETTRNIGAWNGFQGGLWRDAIDVRDFIQQNYTPYEGDDSFLTGPTERTTAVWKAITDKFPEEREKGVYDVAHDIPSTITAHAPGWIDRDKDLIVGLQTDAPLKRAIMPYGGWRMVAGALETYGYPVSEELEKVFTDYRKTHNAGVFDAYTPEIRAARKAGVVTGLPDAYGRGRIIGDYRRVALYGVDRLVAFKKEEKEELNELPAGNRPLEETIRLREELSEQIRALAELKAMAASYGHDISGPATSGREAIQWLYFAYLAAVKEQNGAAMSLGRTSTFVDVYLQRDIEAGVLTEEQAQELVDDFIIKLRIVRFLRTPEYDELFSGDPTWVTESIAGMGEDGRPLVTRSSFRYLQTLYNLGPAPEPNMTVFWSPRLPQGFKEFCARVSIDTSSVQYESDELMRPRFGDDTAIACCVSAMPVGKQMQFFGARVNLAKTLLYAINGGRDEKSGAQVGPETGALTSQVLDYDQVMAKFDEQMEWLASTYVHALNVIHYMHDKYAYERIEMALHDRDVRRTMACGIAGLSVAADSLAAIKYARVTAVRDERTGHRLHRRRRLPGLRQQRRPGRRHRGLAGRGVHEEGAQARDVPGRRAHPVGADHHLERGLRQEDRQHAGRTPCRRTVLPGRQPDERPRHPRLRHLGAVGRQAPVRGRRGRHLADQHRHPRRAGTHPRGADQEPGGRPRRLHGRRRVPHERERPQPRHAHRRHGAPGELPAADDPRQRLRGELRPPHP